MTVPGQARPPNILYLLADDLGWADVGYHGSEIRTPNLDRLARDGVELDQHYVCPMCTPTRASLLTGRHPGRFGRHATAPSNAPVLPDGYETLAAALRNAGYATGLFGKWHLGSHPRYGPNRYGFDYSYGSLAGGVDPYHHRYKEGEYSHTWHRNGELIEERGHVTDLIVEEALQWMEAQERPWFCYVPFTAVHVPIKAPEEWIDAYCDRSYDADPARDRSFKMYAAYASHMDHAIGRLIESLHRTLQVDDTIVVFASDNGAIPDSATDTIHQYPGRQEELPRLGSNLPLRGRKAQLYEGGIRTPAVISWPGTLRPAAVSRPIQVVDWMPTFAGLTGATTAEDPRWDGRDVWPLITGEAAEPDRTLFWNFRGSEFGARIGDLKLRTDGGLQPEKTELFDLAADPGERRDLFADAPGRAADLLDLIRQERALDDASKRPDAPPERSDHGTGARGAPVTVDVPEPLAQES